MSNVSTQGMHRVQKYLTLSDHGYLGYAVIVNKNFWDGLPSALRSQLESALAETTRYANEIAAAENANSLAAVRKSGLTQVIALSAAEKAQWKSALLRVHGENRNRIGKELIEAIYKETRFTP